MPQVTAARDGISVDVTGTSAPDAEAQLDVRFHGLAFEDCQPFDHLAPVGFAVHTIDLVGAEIGDVLLVFGNVVGTALADVLSTSYAVATGRTPP